MYIKDIYASCGELICLLKGERLWCGRASAYACTFMIKKLL